MAASVGVGLIGAGMISEHYLRNLTRLSGVEVLAVGDLDAERARAQAEKHGVPHAGHPEEVLGRDDVELIVNLTIPAVHAEVSTQIIDAGKHVWTEKPLSVDLASAQALLERADAAGLRIGVAPDTVLGRGVQSALRAIERGDIGTPLAARTLLQGPGPDAFFHPNPEFLFAPGAGPVFDMGPYYVTTLVSVLGPALRASAFGLTGRQTRTVNVGDRAGTEFPVQVPTHIDALLEFAGGGVSQSTFSWDSPLMRSGIVEITGTEATLAIPDPNTFDGAVRLTRLPASSGVANEWEDVPVEGVAGGRGLGVADMIEAIREGRPHRASGEMGLHVLEILVAIHASVAEGATMEIASTVERPAPVPTDWDPYEDGGADAG